MLVKNKIYRFSKLVGLTLVFGTLLSGCEKLVTVPDPTTKLVATTVFSDDATAASVLTGIYSQLSTDMMSGYSSVSALMGVAADELTCYTNDVGQSSFYTNRYIGGYDYWKVPYQNVYITNTVLEGLDKSTTVSANIKQQLIGEAKFVRALMYFYLVNLYGDVPLVLGTDYKVNAVVKRTAKNLVYAQIVQDLIDAQQYLTDDYRSPSNLTTAERIRPNKGAATALLARVYMYMGKYPEAEAQASLLINQTNRYRLVDDLNQVFLKNSTEAIWQLFPSIPNYNTNDGLLFILTQAPDVYVNTVSISPSLINSFEAGDKRRTNWVGNITVGNTTYYYPYKYKLYERAVTITEYVMVFRLAEQYLIRAEARIQQGNMQEGIADLNIVRKRARAAVSTETPNPLPDLSLSLSKDDAITAVLHERRIELFTELGHRWFDLKRSNLIDPVMSIVTPMKGGVWTSDYQLLPIPSVELQRDINLTQNPGYPGR